MQRKSSRRDRALRVVYPSESETRFFLKVVDAQVEFVKDAQGTVTH